MSNGIDAIVIGIICASIALGYIYTAAVGWLTVGVCFILMGLVMMILAMIKDRHRS